MYNAKYFKHSISETKTIMSKNNVDLKEIIMVETKQVAHYEIYIEGNFWTRYHDEKTAKKMWKDFSAA